MIKEIEATKTEAEINKDIVEEIKNKNNEEKEISLLKENNAEQKEGIEIKEEQNEEKSKEKEINEKELNID